MAGALGGVAGCGTPEPPQPVSAPELLPELLGAEDALARSARDDFWTASLGDMLSAPELEAYWETPAPERFERYAVRLLEARLQADLLERYRGRMTPEQIDVYCTQPSYDACLAYVEEVTGS
ncbi:MAG: hypothetical protein R3F62_16375 [Planctomycetota bacterium]